MPIFKPKPGRRFSIVPVPEMRRINYDCFDSDYDIGIYTDLTVETATDLRDALTDAIEAITPVVTDAEAHGLEVGDVVALAAKYDDTCMNVGIVLAPSEYAGGLDLNKFTPVRWRVVNNGICEITGSQRGRDLVKIA